MYILIPISEVENAVYLQLQKTQFSINGYVTHTRVEEDLTVSEFAICGKGSFSESELTEAANLNGFVFQNSDALNAWKFEYGYAEWDETTETYIAYQNEL